MRMAQGEKLIKKWESQDTSGCGKTVITLTDRRVASERSLKVGETENSVGQEVMLNSVRGVSCSNARKENEKGLNGWIIGAIVIAAIVVIIKLVFGLTGLIISSVEPEDPGVPDYILEPVNTIFWVGIAIAVVLLIIGLILNKKAPDTVSYSVVLYTNATCTLNAIGTVRVGAKNANGETTVSKFEIPVSYEMAKEIAETIGALLVLARYGVPENEQSVAEKAEITEEKAE